MYLRTRLAARNDRSKGERRRLVLVSLSFASASMNPLPECVPGQEDKLSPAHQAHSTGQWASESVLLDRRMNRPCGRMQTNVVCQHCSPGMGVMKTR